MATIEIDDQDLTVRLSLKEKLLALHGSVTVPLVHIRSVDVAPDDCQGIEGEERFVGLNWPGELTVGTRQVLPGGETVFCDVRTGENAVAIHLDHEKYKRLVIEVDGKSPSEAAKVIRDAAERAKQRAAG